VASDYDAAQCQPLFLQVSLRFLPEQGGVRQVAHFCFVTP